MVSWSARERERHHAVFTDNSRGTILVFERHQVWCQEVGRRLPSTIDEYKPLKCSCQLSSPCKKWLLNPGCRSSFQISERHHCTQQTVGIRLWRTVDVNMRPECQNNNIWPEDPSAHLNPNQHQGNACNLWTEQASQNKCGALSAPFVHRRRTKAPGTYSTANWIGLYTPAWKLERPKALTFNEGV
jgi:hypothetical protein